MICAETEKECNDEIKKLGLDTKEVDEKAATLR
jgi:hypothetical protein